MRLSPFEEWMVMQNLGHAKDEGLGSVVDRLRANGYPKIADGVKQWVNARRHDANGQPYIAYFTSEPSMTYFVWNGVLDDPVQVTHAEAGEPIDDTFLLTGHGVPPSLAEFKRQCDRYLEREV